MCIRDSFLSQHACYVVKGRALGVHQAGQLRVAALWCCMWGRGPRGNSAACSAPCQFSVTSPATHNQIGPFWCWFLGRWACGHSRTLWVSPVNFPVRLGVSPTAAWTPTGFFSQRFWGFIFLGCVVCLAPQLFLPVYLHANVGPPSPPAAALTWVLSAWLPISAPPTVLDECFFFKSLVVRLSYSLVFWQFWLVFVFKFVVLLLVVWGGTVYLPTPPSRPEVPFFPFLKS